VKTLCFRVADVIPPRKAQQLHYLIGRSVVRSLLMKFADSHGNAGWRQIAKPSIGAALIRHIPTYLRRRGVRTDGAIHRPEATPPQIPMQPAE
jgi:hypothetical protein